MKFDSVKFIKSCSKPSDFPACACPEFAFFGRSNTGKSSLINLILGRKNLVKTGARPGMTKLISFFSVDKTASFADLPGYGYAPASVRKTFMPMIRGYAENRKNIALAFLLIDIRRTPKEDEADMISFLTGKKIPVAVVLTKCDKVSGNERKNNLLRISRALNIEEDSFFFSSSHSGEGKKELRQTIQAFISES